VFVRAQLLKGAHDPHTCRQCVAMMSPSEHRNPECFAPTLAALKRSRFRSRFQLSRQDRQYIDAKELETIHRHAYDFVQTRIAPAVPANDGKQTPFKGHPVFVAQHATATCCRGCIEKWHRIRKGKALTAGEIDLIVSLIMAWINRQLLSGKENAERRGHGA
jgi:hypothetical protein